MEYIKWYHKESPIIKPKAVNTISGDVEISTPLGTYRATKYGTVFLGGSFNHIGTMASQEEAVEFCFEHYHNIVLSMIKSEWIIKNRPQLDDDNQPDQGETTETK